MPAMNILVVDDDIEISELLRIILEKEGWSIFSVENGEEALKFIEKQSTDLVILDILLPKIDGREVCRYLCRNYSIPVIMLSALSDSTEKVMCLDSGADDYITKPFRGDELIARIKAVQRRKQHSIKVASSTLVHENLEVDFAARRVAVDGKKSP
jgi:DNA-binding response OmpR family regulator